MEFAQPDRNPKESSWQMNNKYAKYATNLSTYFGASLIPMMLNLIVNPWIAKNMSPEDYAISGYYNSFSSLINPIIVFYMIHYYIKEYFKIGDDERQRLVSAIVKALIWFSGVVSIFCFFVLLIYLKYFNNKLSLPISPYLAFMVFSIPLTGLLNLRLAQYRMMKNAKAFFILSVSNGVLLVLLNIIFIVLFHWGAFGKLLAPLICNAMVFFFMVYKYSEELKIPITWKEYCVIVKFCFPLALSAMLGYFTQGFSTTYLETVGNTKEYGIYVVGFSIGSYLTVFSTAVGATFQPDIYESIIKKLWKRYMHLCLLQIGCLIIIAAAFIIMAPFIIDVLTAGRYVLSTPYARIIALSMVTSNIYYLVNNYSIATDHPNLYLVTTIIGSGLIVLGMPYAVNHYQYVGGCWMTVLSYIAFTLINLTLLFVLSKRINS